MPDPESPDLPAGENEFTVEPLEGRAHQPLRAWVAAAWHRLQHVRRPAWLTCRRARVTVLAMVLVAAYLLWATGLAGQWWQPGGLMTSWQFAPILTQTTIIPAAPRTLPPRSDWQRIPRPPTVGWVLSLAVSPSDPQAALACTGPGSDPATLQTMDGPIGLWRTSDGGQRWQSLPIQARRGTSCEVRMAAGAPQRLLLDVFGSSGCQESHPLLSTDAGQHWRSLSPPLPSLPHNMQSCSLSASISPHHVFATGEYSVLASITTTRTTTSAGTSIGTSANYQTTAWNTRSDDDGQTWTAPAATMTPDMTLAANALGGDGLPLTATGIYFPPADPSAYSTRFWTSSDLGVSWQPEAVLPGFAALGLLAPPGVALVNATASKPLYALTGTSVPWQVFRIRVAQISGHTWALVPPLPIGGTSAAHTGITDVLTATPSDKLLVLGLAPRSALPTGGSGPLKLRQWLWAWDPVAARWDAIIPLPSNVWPSLCTISCWRGSVSVGADPQGSGAYLWLIDGITNKAPALLRLPLPAGV